MNGTLTNWFPHPDISVNAMDTPVFMKVMYINYMVLVVIVVLLFLIRCV